MFDKIKGMFGKKKPEPKTKKKSAPKLSDKEIATRAGEPWVDILKVDVDPEDINNGAFELDWNDIFIARLIKAGYQGKTDQALVDQWFQNIQLQDLKQNKPQSAYQGI